MADREKVIKGLGCCLTLDSPCGDCPYYSYEDIQELDCERNLLHDALELLKEQQKTIKRLQDKLFANPDAWIHCKDCKWHDNPDKSTKWLPCMEIRTLNNWFCADGER